MTNEANKTHARLSGVEGFTLVELMTAVAILGILVMMAAPSMVRMLQRQETKTSATQMAGLLSDARSRAISEGTPHLVYFNPPTVDANGECGAAALEVRDADHSYSITDGDDTREFHLPASSCRKVTPMGEGESAVTVAEIPMPREDLAVKAADALEVGAVASRGASAAAAAAEPSDNSGPGNSGGAGNSGSSAAAVAAASGSTLPPGLAVAALRTSKVVDTVVNGATFPVDADSGRPVIAFSEHGIPVDPADPNAWGSGAGGIYLTDGDSTVVAALVAPLGDIKLRTFDASSQTWK